MGLRPSRVKISLYLIIRGATIIKDGLQQFLTFPEMSQFWHMQLYINN